MTDLTATDLGPAPAADAPVDGADDGRRIVTTDTDRLPKLDAELERLNKIAARLGVDPLSYAILERGTRHVVEHAVTWDGWPGKGAEYDVETVTVEILGSTPRLPGGWKFLGSIEFAEAGTLVHGDDERLAPYRAKDADCDHCGYKRDRKKVVVLENDEGALTAVGSTCIKDFLGYHGDPEKVLWFSESIADMLGELDDDDMGGRFYRGAEAVPTEHFTALASAVVRTFGWVPKSSYNGIPTAARVADILFPPRRDKHNADYLDELREVEVTDEDMTKGKLVRVWAIKAADESPGNNYLGNLKVVLSGNYVERGHFGLAASVVGAYDRAMGKEIARKARNEAWANLVESSDYLGTVGKREGFAGTVTGIFPYETMYGSGRVVKLITEDGKVLKSMTSGNWAWTIEVGDKLTIKGTVKRHEEYRGVKETELSRVALLTREAVNADDPIKCGDPIKHAYGDCDCPKEDA